MHFETISLLYHETNIYSLSSTNCKKGICTYIYSFVPNFRGKSNNQIAIFEVKYLKFHLGAFYSTRPATLH